MKKIAVIGLGNISIRHRNNIKFLYPESSIFAMPASNQLPHKPIINVDIFAISLDEIISLQPDMAIVASPATLHAKHTIPLLKAGIPVLVEKPLSASEADSKAIIDAAEYYQTPVAVGYCLRYLSSSQYIKSLLKKSIIGDIYNAFIEIGQYLPDWRPNKDYHASVSANAHLGGGALLELSHELDYIQWLLGDLTPHSAILRSSQELELVVEDFADILARNTEGAIISIHLDFLQRKAHRKCRLIGSKGSLDWDLLRNEITLTTANSEDKIFSESNLDKNTMYLNMLLDFERLINGKPNQCITLLEAKNTVSLIAKIKALA